MTDDRMHDEQVPPPSDNDEDDPGWPWSFLLLVFAGGAYLVFRFVEIIAELF